MKRILAICAVLALAACGESEAQSEASVKSIDIPGAMQKVPAKQLFGARATGSRQAPAPYGGYSKGCLAGGVQLPETGPTWQAMRLSRNRNWGHPETIDFIQRLSAKAAQQPGWNGLYIGDISQPRGGPMLTGHRSHQVGLDIDIWMRPANRLNLSRTERENLSSISMRRSKGAFTNGDWTRAHHEIIKAAAQDPRTARIFVFPGAKVRMCKDETGDRSWLNKIRPWYGHHYHFHVRLKCPRGARGCVDQSPPPRGDGCADAQRWVNNILNPPPPDPDAPKPKPRVELTMANLPNQCVSVLQSP
ncbi:penicillin-insensitive murein endopeptidase [Roseovarius sp. SCSIO 43702]|uniref:penicillin-insensitive murein endopeptidase n=1 Tax=Roseovarius sp. SCSIO 43702 TaxID=2823043 RepID=UPI001C72A93C|nr:penicillin-insensitive murein endopeptidase [Roseovarius sp. SCSIO 43702]QYX56955.1 penicillin-insensitive murein endopeptidase [Roseovarius sp. SCSIO 43702]